MFATTVHTTGINWDGVLANVASITVVVAIIAGVVTRSLKASIKEEIRKVISTEVMPLLEDIKGEIKEIKREISAHDTRIARLEGIDEGKRQALQQARTTSTE